MGVVTSGTGSLIDGIVPMGLFEGCLTYIMTSEAKNRFTLYQEIFLIGAMGKMAGCASLCLQDFMNPLLFKGFLFVALIAGFISFRFQQPACLRGVGVMTSNTFALLQNRMNIGFIQPDLLFAVAGEAKIIAIFFQEEFGHDSMAEMAVFALLFFYHGMNIFHSQVFIHKFLVAGYAFLTGKSRFGSGGFGARGKNDSA